MSLFINCRKTKTEKLVLSDDGDYLDCGEDDDDDNLSLGASQTVYMTSGKNDNEDDNDSLSLAASTTKYTTSDVEVKDEKHKQGKTGDMLFNSDNRSEHINECLKQMSSTKTKKIVGVKIVENNLKKSMNTGNWKQTSIKNSFHNMESMSSCKKRNLGACNKPVIREQKDNNVLKSRISPQSKKNRIHD